MGKIPYYEVADKLKELKFNPFRYRIAKVFTSSESGFMTFDDFLEMVTVMSDKAPLSSKLIWAFRIFDSNEDGRLCKEDLNVLLDVLSKKRLDQDLKDCLIDEVLNEADEDGDRVLTYSEFARVRHFILVQSSLGDPDHREKFRIPKLDFDPQSLGGKA
eukprot:Em0420g2a